MAAPHFPTEKVELAKARFMGLPARRSHDLITCVSLAPPSEVDADRVSEPFRVATGLELLTALDAEPDVVYAVDRTMTLHFVNRAWRRFALEHEGETCLRTYRVGASVTPAIPAALRAFYGQAFASVFAGGMPIDHLYECPSPTQERSFRMRAALVPSTNYVIVSNQLVREIAVDRAADGEAVKPEDYVGSDGIVVQCSHCRRCRRIGIEQWDWVPEYAAHSMRNVSHGLCASCFAHYYPGLDIEMGP